MGPRFRGDDGNHPDTFVRLPVILRKIVIFLRESLEPVTAEA